MDSAGYRTPFVCLIFSNRRALNPSARFAIFFISSSCVSTRSGSFCHTLTRADASACLKNSHERRANRRGRETFSSEHFPAPAEARGGGDINAMQASKDVGNITSSRISSLSSRSESLGTKPEEAPCQQGMLQIDFDKRIFSALDIHELDTTRCFRWTRSWPGPF